MSDLDSLLGFASEGATRETHRRNIEKFASEAFRYHRIVSESDDVFLCRRPKTRIYSFRVAFLPAGMIVVYGDIGDMMVQRGGFDWLNRAITHDFVSDYVMSKALPRDEHRAKEFMPGEACAEIRRLHDTDPELAVAIANDWLKYDKSGRDGESWDRSYWEHTGDCEFPRCRDYSSNDLWCYQGLSWFVKNVGK